MKQQTKDFVFWLEQQQSQIKSRTSTSRGQQWLCYSLDISNPYETLPEWLHDHISEMEAEEIHSREFWIPNQQSYRSGIGRLITDDWIDFKLKWKYQIKT